MNPDVYFCACVGHEPDMRDAVLSVLRTLGVRAPHAAAMSIALKELERCDSWTRVYAVPSLLRAIDSRELHPQERARAAGLARSVAAGSAGGRVAELLDLYLEGAAVPRLSKAVEAAAQALIRADTAAPSITPYMDLPSQAARVVWLAVLRQVLAPGSAQAIGALFERETDTRAVVDAALANVFGRLPVRLAIDVMELAGRRVPDDQLAGICAAAGNADLEPDLVWIMQARVMAGLPDDPRAVTAAMRGAAQSAAAAETPQRWNVLIARLGGSVPAVKHAAAKAEAVAAALRAAARFEFALERRPGAVFGALQYGIEKGAGWLWLPIRPGKPWARHGDVPDVVTMRMDAIVLALANWVEARPDEDLPPVAWAYATHAVDALYTLRRPNTPQAGAGRRSNPPHSAAAAVFSRVAASRLPLRDVVQHTSALPDRNYGVVLKARIAVRLIDWFLNAYRQGVDWRAEKSWLDDVHALADFARPAIEAARALDQVVVDRDVVNAACVDVLFAQGDVRDWVRVLPAVAVDQLPGITRMLLLPLRPRESDWYALPGVPPTDKNHTALFVATGRCAFREPGSTKDPGAEWDAELSKVSFQEVDRLLRVRLVRLLDTEAFDHERKLRIVALMLTSDSPFDLDLVLRQVFERAGAASPLADAAHSLLVSRVESERQRGEHRDTPNAVATEFDRADAVRVCVDWLARLMSAPGKTEWLDRFESRREAARALRGALLRPLEHVVEYRNGYPVLLPEQHDVSERPLRVTGAAFDDVRQRATLVGTVFEPDPRAARGVLAPVPMAGQPQLCVGLVEGLRAEGAGWAARIHLGLTGTVEVALRERPAWQPGDWVDVPLQWDGERTCSPARTGVPELVRPQLRDGDLEPVVLHVEERDGSAARFGVDLQHAPRLFIDKSPWRPTPDTTPLRSLRRWASYESGRWVPHIEDRLGLLAAMARTKAERAVVAWENLAVTTPAGETAWVVDAGGGLRYALAASDFDAESAGRLRALLESARSDAADGSQRSQLVADALVVLERTPQGVLKWIEVRRERLDWKDLYHPGDPEVVLRDEQGDHVRLSPQDEARFPNRPRRIRVTWQGARGEPPNLAATVIGWDALAAELRVKTAAPLRAQQDRWPQLCAWWLDLDEGQRMTVDGVRSIPGRDTVAGLTHERFNVDIPAEEWWGWDAPVAGTDFRKRECRISFVGDWAPLIAEIPAASTDSRYDLAAPEWHGCIGVLCAATRSRHALWSAVVWVDEEPRVVQLEVDVPEDAHMPRAGDRLHLAGRDGRCRVRVERRRVMARPIWTLHDDTEGLDPNARRVPVRARGALGFVALGTPGHLHIDAGVTHHPVFPAQQATLRWASRPFQIPEARSSVSRALAEIAPGQFITGHLPGGSGERLRHTRLDWSVADELMPVPGGSAGEVHLLRTLRVAALRAPAQGSPEEESEEKLRKDLESLIEDARPVPVRALEGELELLDLTLPAPERSGKGSRLPVADGQLAYVSYCETQPGGLAILVRTDRLRASTKRVPPKATVESWAAWLESAGVVDSMPTPGATIDLGNYPLFYVGPEKVDPVDGRPYDEGLRFRFECAPGQCLVLPGRLLRFRGGEFDAAANQLFFGDRIGRVKVGEGAGAGWVLEVMEVAMRSHAHMLFDQAQDWNVVHLLHVHRAGERLAIGTVQGVDDSRRELRPAPFAVRATLTEGGEQKLLQALGEGEGGQVHGRLDQQSYLASAGRVLEFEPVWLTLGPGGLNRSERVFLTAGRITIRDNDCFLAFDAPAGLIGPQARLQPMRRRGFSARVDLLYRIAAERPDALAGMQYLVQLLGDKDRTYPSILDHDKPERLPYRLDSQLRQWLRRDTEPPLVTVIDHQPGARTLLEVRPGVFAAANALDGPTDVSAGTVLRLFLAKGRKSIVAVPAMPSDTGLVPPKGRGITLLPFPPQWMEGAEGTRRIKLAGLRFAGEGLPDATGVMSDLHQGGEMLWLLSQPHPRPAWLLRDNEPAVSPRVLDAPVFLEPLPAAPVLHPWSSAEQPHRTEWPVLTFADLPAATVIETATQRLWSAQDRRTWVLASRAEARGQDVEPVNASRALLFAEISSQALRLRYTAGAIERFLFSPRELATMLSSHPRSSWRVTVANVDIERRWFVVEVAPGRLHVLPLALLVTQGELGTHEFALGELALECFGVGDVLEICRATGRVEEVDRIRLLGWTPGARAALGGERMALRLQAVDAAAGACQYGSGRFVLTLPGSAPADAVNTLALIDRDNHRAPPPKGLAGSGALLRRRDDDTLAIDGLEDFRCRPFGQYDWDSDPVGSHLFTPPAREGGPLGAGPVVRDAGGTVPVSIDYIDIPGRTIYFSRNRLHGASIQGVCPVEVLNATARGTCLLRAGSQLRIANLRELVFGLPEEFDSPREMAEELAAAARLQWARLADGGAVRGGLGMRREPGETGSFAPVAIVGPNGTVRGVVCECLRSRALHWLPVAALAWVDLSAEPDALTNLLLEREVVLSATVQPDDSLSVTAQPLARGEFASAAPGTELVVRSTGIRLASGEALVRSAISDVLLSFAGTPQKQGETKAIVRRRDRVQQTLHAELRVAGQLRLDLDPGANVEVAPVIEEILRLHASSATRSRARLLFHELVRRAWRHWPAELLQTTGIPMRAGLWNRYAQLQPVLLGAAPGDLKVLLGFCRDVELTQWGRDGRDDPQLLRLAAAARALAGDVAFHSVDAMQAAKTANRIAALAHLSPPRAFITALPDAVVDGLEKLLADLRLERTPLTFGPPLPALG